jgi:tetratricopeptide (TPR) repeat protein
MWITDREARQRVVVAARGWRQSVRLLELVIVVVLAGCAGAMDDVANRMGPQGKYYDAAKEAAAAGRNYDAAVQAMEALRIKVDYIDAKILLRQVAPKAYEERLTVVRQTEQTNVAQALEQYKELKRFTDAVGQQGVPVATVDYDGKFRELEGRISQVKTAEASKMFAEAEAFFQSGQCSQAIPAYRRVLELTPGEGVAKERIAECLYRGAVADLQGKRYRKAAEGFKEAAVERPGYKDSQVRAGRIYAALGAYFLKAGHSRNALVELEAANRLAPDTPRLKMDLEAAQREAVKRLAVAGMVNKSGQRIEGIALEDFITDELQAELQRKKSPYVELYDRSQLEAVLKEQKLNLSELVDKATAQQLGKLKGVGYVILGKLTQVSQKRAGPSKTVRAGNYQTQEYRTESYVDNRGRRQTRNVPAGTRQHNFSWEEVNWASEVAFVGSVNVLKVETAKIVTASNFSKKENIGGHWAENLSDPNAKGALSSEVRKLFDAPKGSESLDTITKRVATALVAELAGSILSELDQTPAVADPAQLAGTF